MNNALVTVILPCFNGEEFLSPAIESILTQSYERLELIIIDDGSTDNSAAIITGFKDDRITFLQQENSGKAKAVNRALDLAKGDYWVLQDADDISHKNRLQSMIAILEDDPSLGAVFSGNDLIINGEIVAPRFEPLTRMRCKELVNKLKLPAHDACGMYRTSCTTDLRFDESLRIGQGVDFVFRFAELHEIELAGKCLYSHRINHSSTTHRSRSSNQSSINCVFEKACKRRGTPFTPVLERRSFISKLFPHRDKDNFISYAVESVAQLRRANQLRKALQTAWFCIKRHPLDPLFYKPFFRLFVLGR